MTENANSRLNGIWEKAAIGLLTLVLSYQQLQFQDQKAATKELEGRVLALYTEKVSRGDLKDVEDRINSKIDGMKADIVARIDLYFGKLESNKR